MNDNGVKYPTVTVRLSGKDGNAYAIIGRVATALRRAGVEPDTVRKFIAEATAHDYDHLLRTCMRWVTVN